MHAFCTQLATGLRLDSMFDAFRAGRYPACLSMLCKSFGS